MRMTKLKFNDATITKAIQVNETNFDLSVNALVKLKEVNVSQTVIQAMLSANSSRKTSDTRFATPSGTWTVSDVVVDLPQEVGVYVKQKGALVTIDPEIVNWRTGGVLKEHVTLGLDRGHKNGTVSGPHSKLTLSWPPFGLGSSIEFYVKCVEGNSASEYQLLHFWEKGDRREFRAVTGGVLHLGGHPNPANEGHLKTGQ